MNAISKTPGAERDLLRQANYMEETASLEAAERFYDAAERAFADLAEMPGMGRRKETGNPHPKDLRQWPIPGFDKHLIFYRPTGAGVEIVRVLHGARDIKRLLAEEDGL